MSSAEALQELVLDPRFIGARIGIVGVLQTWTRDLRYDPHGHYVVAGGALFAEGTWLPARQDFLVHVTPRSMLLRAKFRAYLQKTDLFPLVDAHVGTKDRVVHCKPLGSGEEVFRHLAPYIVSVASGFGETPHGSLAREARAYGQARGVIPLSWAYLAADASTSGRTSA